jgi:hypothetical protein
MAALLVLGSVAAFGGRAYAGFNCSYTINDVTMAEGNAGTTNFVFTVTQDHTTPAPVPDSITYTTADGTAAAPGDYQTTSGTLTFDPTTPTKTITVPVVGDVAFEGNETFFVNLTDDSTHSCPVLDSQGVAPIVDIRGAADGSGYWLASLDGGVFTFDVPFYGSATNYPPQWPVIAIAGQR